MAAMGWRRTGGEGRMPARAASGQACARPAELPGFSPRVGVRMQPGFSLRLSNRLLELDRIAEAVEAFGEAHGLSPKLRYQIRLVLDELLTNIISYGYPDDTERSIQVVMGQTGSRLRFRHRGRRPAVRPPVGQKPGS